jgi:GntR family transcriptional repressor for pyruvate dehydrogenase complex
MDDGMSPRRILDASEQVAQQLRLLISSRRLEPGDRIGTEAELGTLLGVSRPTLREAIRLLSGSHVVRSAKGPGGGVFLAASPETGMGRSVSRTIAALFETQSLPVEEMLEARRAIEVPMAGLAATKRDDAELEVMRQALEFQAVDPERRMGDTDQRFHLAIARSTHNRLLGAFIEWAFEVLQPQLIITCDPFIDFRMLLAQHREILAMIEQRDAAGSEDAMRAHLDYIAEIYHQSMRFRRKLAEGLVDF